MSDDALIAKVAGSVGALPKDQWDALAGGNPFVSHDFLTALEDSGSVGPGTGWQAAPIVIEGADGRFLGGCGLNRVDTMHRYANLGYWLRRTALRQGIATAAVRLLRDYAFARTILDRLEIIVAVQNTASQRVAERVGAVREGKLREALLLHGQRHDAVLYSLLRSDPR